MLDANRAARWMPLALSLAVVALYAPSLTAPFLSYDDPWLVTDNPVLRDAAGSALRAIWTRFDLDTRMVLGAEYLPVRDTFAWLVARVAGLSPLPHRAAQLGVYLGAVLALRAWLRRVLPARPGVAEVTAWLFALHPAHVSSVAWVAGTKDALSLLFLALALDTHARAPRGRPGAAAALTALACLSKGTSVVAPALLVASDLLARRRVAWRAVAASGAVALASVAAQLSVGRVVHMIAEPLGRTFAERVASMAPVALRYVQLSLLLERPCIAREVAPRAVTDPLAWASLAVIVAVTAAAAVMWRRGHRLPLVAVGLFAAGLAPVSQVLAPLQNRMADRYLLVAVLGPCLAAAALLDRLAWRRAVAAAAVVTAAALSALHVAQFSDEAWLWSDAMARTRGPLAPYQLAHLLRARGDLAGTERMLRETLARDAMSTPASASAATNLSQLLAVSGRADEAIALLRRAIVASPGNPRARFNLASLLHARGEVAEARGVLREVVMRFPDYPRARAAWTQWYGPLPADAPRPASAPYAYDRYAR
ncbi:MAG: tetratricopeptide repeat protein [Polyangiales bacterium]